jgi:hypothetical protein
VLWTEQQAAALRRAKDSEASSAANLAVADLAQYGERGRVAARIEKGGFTAERDLGN